MTTHHQLADIRQQIDTLDQRLYKLIKQRAELAHQVAQIKQQSDPKPAYYRPEREAQILQHIMSTNDSLIDDKALAQIFRDIMTACLAVQKPMTVAFLGPQGTFSQVAVEQHFGKTIGQLPVTDIFRVFREVEAGNVDFGVVPIENSTEGVVNITLDAFINSNLQICGEIEIPIHQHLLRAPNATASIQKIYSHQQSLSQCRQWLAQHMPNAERIVVASNAKAAELAKQDLASAAIAGQLAAQLYDLDIVTHQIQDSSQNTTRFVIIGQQAVPPSSNDKTSLLVTSPNVPGAMLSLVQPFADQQVNLTLIESRPYHHQNWRYIFFIDIEGHQQDPAVQRALDTLMNMPIMLTILGSYPKAIS
ncbi:MAG: prephenate dehydratase [Legionellales bacterium]|nr:prephenate dehydratase [Legionellales bacterium]